MKNIFCLLILASSISHADNGDITVTIDSVSNTARSEILHVCGKAVSKTQKWPLLVTLTHGSSSYSTLTAKDGIFCQLVARETNSGKVTADAVPVN